MLTTLRFLCVWFRPVSCLTTGCFFRNRLVISLRFADTAGHAENRLPATFSDNPCAFPARIVDVRCASKGIGQNPLQCI